MIFWSCINSWMQLNYNTLYTVHDPLPTHSNTMLAVSETKLVYKILAHCEISKNLEGWSSRARKKAMERPPPHHNVYNPQHQSPLLWLVIAGCELFGQAHSNPKSTPVFIPPTSTFTFLSIGDVSTYTHEHSHCAYPMKLRINGHSGPNADSSKSSNC